MEYNNYVNVMYYMRLNYNPFCNRRIMSKEYAIAIKRLARQRTLRE